MFHVKHAPTERCRATATYSRHDRRIRPINDTFNGSHAKMGTMASSVSGTKSEVGERSPARGTQSEATQTRPGGLSSNETEVASKPRAAITRHALTGALAAATAARAKATPAPPATNTRAQQPKIDPTPNVDSTLAAEQRDSRQVTPGLRNAMLGNGPSARATSGAALPKQRTSSHNSDPSPKPVKPLAQTLTVGGTSYRVVTSASPTELTRLAAIVDDKLMAIAGKAGGHTLSSPQTILLAAIALAHDAELAIAERTKIERRTRDMVRRTLLGLEDIIDRNSAENVNEAKLAELATGCVVPAPEPTAAGSEHQDQSTQRLSEPVSSFPDKANTANASAEAAGLEACQRPRLRD
jgi:cell division protein ZapA